MYIRGTVNGMMIPEQTKKLKIIFDNETESNQLILSFKR